MADRKLAAVLKSLLSAAVLFSSLAVLDASWIPLKAGLAQVLLQRSWEQQKSGKNSKPWPWADTHAIARLQVPRLGIDQIVLEGSSGRNLAFGPVLSGSGLQQMDLIINAHRDTHFRFLQQLQPGDLLQLETANGLKSFSVTELEVIDSSSFNLVVEPGLRRLSLVTCYPFDALVTGGPLRYVVTALSLQASQDTAVINRPVASSG